MDSVFYALNIELDVYYWFLLSWYIHLDNFVSDK